MRRSPRFGLGDQGPGTAPGYYRARHYSTADGRFLQTDPHGYDQGTNLYAYVGNDPLNLIDPDGLQVLDAVQTGLTVASFCPSICGSLFGALDAGVCAARGNYFDATVSAGAAAVGPFTSAGAAKVAATGIVGAAGALKAARSAETEAASVMRYSGRRMDVRAKFIDSPSAQATAPGHSFASRREAYRLALDPEVQRVTMNAGYNRLLRLEPGTISPNVRPDVSAV